MNTGLAKCPICELESADVSSRDLDGSEYSCQRCGRYIFLRTLQVLFEGKLKPREERLRSYLSAYVRQSFEPPKLDQDNWDRLRNPVAKQVLRKGRKSYYVSMPIGQVFPVTWSSLISNSTIH